MTSLLKFARNTNRRMVLSNDDSGHLRLLGGSRDDLRLLATTPRNVDQQICRICFVKYADDFHIRSGALDCFRHRHACSAHYRGKCRDIDARRRNPRPQQPLLSRLRSVRRGSILYCRTKRLAAVTGGVPCQACAVRRRPGWLDYCGDADVEGRITSVIDPVFADTVEFVLRGAP